MNTFDEDSALEVWASRARPRAVVWMVIAHAALIAVVVAALALVDNGGGAA